MVGLMVGVWVFGFVWGGFCGCVCFGVGVGGWFGVCFRLLVVGFTGGFIWMVLCVGLLGGNWLCMNLGVLICFVVWVWVILLVYGCDVCLGGCVC